MTSAIDNDFSVIIPTFREANNVAELAQRFASIDFGDRQFEVIFVDDNSQDGIVEIVRDLALQYPWLKIIVRTEQRSLSQAVITGFKHARYPLLVCMDADLSHPPEKIPEMLAALADREIDFVIGSRYIAGGSTDQTWPLSRRIFSRCAAELANLVIFANDQIKDPLSGFCALRKSTFCSNDKLNPIGWKIGLEMMIKFHCKKIKEIPIHFSDRKQGVSKLTLKVALNYLRHIQRLVWFKLMSR